MQIALIGATGFIGSCILKELSDRGHAVTALVRKPEDVPALVGVTPQRADANDPTSLAALLAGHDAVISSVHFTAAKPENLLSAVRKAGVARYLVVGGAGSLEVAPGVAVFDTPDFPADYLPESKAGGAFLDLLRQETALDWTFLSPAADISPGERTGQFRLGEDRLIVDASGRSHISTEDYAVALVDELERPAHSRQRFTLGY